MPRPNPSMPLITPMTESRTMTKNYSTQPEFILIESISQEPQPFPSNIRVFSKELDDSPHSSSPQLILSLCTVSIAFCNKLFENMMPFYGDKSKPRISGNINNKNVYWIIDTGSVVTCMNINSFETAFGKTLKINEKAR
jgi:hypothetical protein